MKQKELNDNLIRIIKEAQELKIPVPDNICGNVTINPRPKKRYGCCRKNNGSFNIEVSQFILECEPDKIRNVLAHEILHTCRGCYDHGSTWKKYAAMMNERYGYNIKRTSSHEEMGIKGGNEEKSNISEIKYIIKCRSCGREYPRKRFTRVMKNLTAYRCRCGGKLMLLKNVNIQK